MKRLAFALLFGLLLCAGCARHYVVTLNNGAQIATSTKPHLKGNSYVFKDAMGNQRIVSTGSVSQIAPASMTQNNQGAPFATTGQ